MINTAGPTRANPFISGSPQTPFIAELPGGAEAFGITGIAADSELGLTGGNNNNGPNALIDFPSIVANSPKGASLALLDEQFGSTPFEAEFPGYTFVLYINLTDQPLDAPQLGVGQSGYLQDLLQEGYQNDPLFGGSGPVTLSQLGPYQVYTTLVPTSSTNFNAAFSRSGTSYSGSTASLTEGIPFYIGASVPPASLQGTSFSVVQAQTFNGLVGTFTDSDPTSKSQDFITSIDWGDQTPPSAGEVIEGTSGVFQVIGWHTYAARGTYPVTISVEDPSGQVVTSAPGSLGTASVSAAPPSLVASAVVATLGTEFDGIVATVTDPDPSLPASDYSALIDWGDGTAESAGTVTGARRFRRDRHRPHDRRGAHVHSLGRVLIPGDRGQ